MENDLSTINVFHARHEITRTLAIEIVFTKHIKCPNIFANFASIIIIVIASHWTHNISTTSVYSFENTSEI